MGGAGIDRAKARGKRRVGKPAFWFYFFGALVLLISVFPYLSGMNCDDPEECLTPFLFMGAGAGALVALSLFVIGSFVAGRRRADVFTISVGAETLRRGDPVEIAVGIHDPEKIGSDLEAGIVCTNSYDIETETWSAGSDSTHDQRTTKKIVAFEEWVPLEIRSGEQRVTLAPPPDGPYSHEGNVTSYRWEAKVRSRRAGLDKVVSTPLWVLP